MGIYVSNKGGYSSNATEVNNCTFGYNNESPLEDRVQSKVSLTFSKTEKKDSKPVLEKLCPTGKSTCKAEVKIALVNCNVKQKRLIYCEFHSIQIFSSDNTIDLNRSGVINTSIHINTEMLKTLNFTTDSKYLTMSGTTELVNCSLVKIEAPAASTDATSTTAASTTTTTTTMPTITTNTTASSTTTINTTTTTTTKSNTTSTTTTITTATPTTTRNSTATINKAVSTTPGRKAKSKSSNGKIATPTATRNSTATINKTVSATPGRKAKSNSSNGKIALVILAIFILMGVGIIACYYKYRKKLSNRPAYYNDISLNDPLHTEIKFYKADGEDTEDNVEEDDDDDDILPLI